MTVNSEMFDGGGDKIIDFKNFVHVFHWKNHFFNVLMFPPTFSIMRKLRVLVPSSDTSYMRESISCQLTSEKSQVDE